VKVSLDDAISQWVKDFRATSGLDPSDSFRDHLLSAGMSGMIEMRGVTKVYRQGPREVHSLRDVSLRVEAGEFVAIVGPSGAGKSTILHLLGGLDIPTAGQVLFAGHDLRRLDDRVVLRRREIGLVFQSFNLLPSLTTAENVALPLLLAGQRRDRALGLARDALSRLDLVGRQPSFDGLDNRSNRRPAARFSNERASELPAK